MEKKNSYEKCHKHPAGYIVNVDKESIAEELGICKGDILLRIDEQPIVDIFDYRYFCASEEIVVEIQKENGELIDFEIEKDYDEDLGLVFENPLMTEEKSCKNKCVFCFIDQMPPGMRDTLYFKDDDSRLSFLTGNYATLTNMKDDEIDRIIKYHLSPINISVHTVNPELRCRMMNNRFAGDILEKIHRFVDHDIQINCQTVLCPGWNDGKELDRTIKELSKLYPNVESVSVVPVGITKYRDDLERLEPVSKEKAKEVIEQVEAWQEKNLKEHDSRIVYLSDEFYLKAEEALPNFDDYEDFPQLENGVGMITLMEDEIGAVCDLIAKDHGSYELPKKRNILICTGVAAAGSLRRFCDRIESVFKGLKVDVVPIKNDFFGHEVTVAGLITGQDLIKTLKTLDTKKYDKLMISDAMLRNREESFLDDILLKDIEKEFDLKIEPCGNAGVEFIQCLTNVAMAIDEEWED